MKTYPIPMVPGPVMVPEAIRRVYLEPYGSGDQETEFVELYTCTQRRLKAIFGTRDDIVIQSGEGMPAYHYHSPSGGGTTTSDWRENLVF